MAGVSAACYFGLYLPVAASAGHETSVSVIYNFAAHVKIHVWLAWGVAASCAYGWTRERKARLRDRSEKDSRIAHLEKQFDTKRTSSGLTVRGDVVPKIGSEEI